MKKIWFFIPPTTETGEIIIRWNAHTEMPKPDDTPTATNHNHARSYFSPALRSIRSSASVEASTLNVEVHHKW